MGKALLLASTISASVSGNTVTVAGSLGTSVNAPATRSNYTARIAGTYSKLAVLADAIGTGRTVTFRKNGADATQTVAPTDTTAGLYEDTTHSDSIAAGDIVNMRPVSTGTPTYYWYRQVFSATSNHACIYFCATQNTNVGASTTNYFPICGNRQGSALTVEANAQCLIRAGGTFGNLQINVTANSRSDATTVKSRKNGADGNQSISIGAGLTGVFEDTSNTDTVTSGDLLAISFVTGGGTGTLSLLGAVGGSIINTTSNSNDIFATRTTGATRAASGTPDYYFIAGDIVTPGSEALAKVQHGFAVKMSGMRLYVSANTYAATATVVLRVNGADTPLTFTIGAGATGWFEDTTHAVAVGADNDVCISIVGGTSGSLTMRTLGLTEREQLPRVQAFLAG